MRGPGVFSVAKEGLFDVTVDQLLEHGRKTAHPVPPQPEVDEKVAAEALEYLATLNLESLVLLKGNDGQPLLGASRTPAIDRFKQLLDRLPDGRERRMVIHKLRRKMARDAAAMRAKEVWAEDRLSLLRFIEAGALDLRALKEQGTVYMMRPTGTVLHRFRDALATERAFDLRRLQCQMTETDQAGWTELAGNAEVFVVEHNWAAAFRGATDYEFGEVHLPSECCCFEFRISNHAVLAFATEVDGVIYIQHAVEAANGAWFIFDVERSSDPPKLTSSVLQTITDSIRAIVIALDAEVAETTAVRAPHKLNAARERRGKLPIASYHIVSLADRSRAPRLHSDGEPPAHHKRLHFRRGHWRHFETWKTWIRWTLVGDPDLGFVDKHYRL